MKTILPAILLFSAVMISACSQNAHDKGSEATASQAVSVEKSDKEWREILSPEQYYILREKGTERAFTGKLWDNHDKGVYYCAACHAALFNSQTKFESGTGWPSFYQPISTTAIAVNTDSSHGMIRDEVVCSRCGGHLGHVFDDGPDPTGLRYCMNSAAMTFEADSTNKK